MREVMIERWFPVNEVNIECARERGGPNILPPLYYLHIWWARRPLTASRVASILAAIPYEDLTEEERKQLLYRMGFKGDPIAASERRARGEKNAFGYPVTEGVNPDADFFREKMREFWGGDVTGADFMAGGGSIPFEMIRSGYDRVIAAEYNPVAWLILKASLEYPVKYGERLVRDVEKYGKILVERIREKLREYYPPHPKGQPVNYIWVKMFRCSECGVEIPALKSLWLDREKGYAVYPEVVGNEVRLHVVKVEEIKKIKVGNREESLVRIVEGPFEGEQFETKGFVRGGKLVCPKHGHVLEGEDLWKVHKENMKFPGRFYSNPIKLVAIVHERREYSEPTSQIIKAYERSEEDLVAMWGEIESYIPQQSVVLGQETERFFRWGLTKWTELFNARQLLVHAEMVKTIRDLYYEVIKDASERGMSEDEAVEYAKAIVTYLTIMFGKLLDYNSILTVWHTSRGVLVHTFDSHAYAWTWDFGEAGVIHPESGLSWILKNVLKSLRGITKRVVPSDVKVAVLFEDAEQISREASIDPLDIIFIDPPYLGNVQYSEISDYFYVWFRLILKDVFPEVFSAPETPKDQEAVANKVRHGSQELANLFYERKMRNIFNSVREALLDDGVFLLWFAHKTGEAWSRTIKALLDSGFSIRAIWGVRSEMERSVHISGKAALKTSMIFVCRKRPDDSKGGYIQDALAELRSTIEGRLIELYDMDLFGPDFLIGAMAHALKVASNYWPLKDPAGELSSDEALNLLLDKAVGEAINFLTRKVAPQVAAVDSLTKFYVLARYLYKDLIPYDDARRLAIACLGATQMGDPVEELVVKSGLGKIAKEQVSGERAKVVRLLSPSERLKGEKLFKKKPYPMIDYVHKAVALLEQGKGVSEVAKVLAEPGRSVCEILKVLEAVLPDQVGKKRNMEKIHVRTLLYTVCGEDSYLLTSVDDENGGGLEEYLG